jgi:hypothetical protein
MWRADFVPTEKEAAVINNSPLLAGDGFHFDESFDHISNDMMVMLSQPIYQRKRMRLIESTDLQHLLIAAGMIER